jgi:selenophosphate synthetase-related protein
LSITALGRTDRPVRSAGGRPGQAVSLTADLSGHWRRGHTGRQWDSSTGRSPAELRAMTALVARHNPAAAKDVSMAGLVGTLGMLAESSGCAAVLDVAAIPRPAAASMGDWLSCFPGFAMLTADEPGHAMPDSPTTTSAVCGQLVGGEGVSLRWPDGEITEAIAGAVTGLGASGTEDH